MGSCPDSCVRGLAKTTLESGFFKKTGFVWTDSLGTLTISADVFPVVVPKKLLFGWKDRTDDRKEVCVRKLVGGWLIRVKKKTIFGFKTIRIRCRKECRRMEQKEVTYEQALHFEVERTRERAAKPRGAEEELLSPPLALASHFACGTRVTSRDSPIRRACSRAKKERNFFCSPPPLFAPADVG